MSIVAEPLRTKVILALRRAGDVLRDVRPHGCAGHARRDEHRDPPARLDALPDAIASGCTAVGISPQDYSSAVEADPELEELQRRTFDEALTEAPDPGPYAAISRESMSGKPGDLSKSRTHPEPPQKPEPRYWYKR